VDVAVQHDRKTLADIGGGNLIEQLGTQVIELDGHVRLIELGIDPHLGISQKVAGDHRLFLHHDRNFSHGACRRINHFFLQQFGIVRNGCCGRGDVLSHHLELETSGTADQFYRALRILDARQLHHDMIDAFALDCRL